MPFEGDEVEPFVGEGWAGDFELGGVEIGGEVDGGDPVEEGALDVAIDNGVEEGGNGGIVTDDDGGMLFENEDRGVGGDDADEMAVHCAEIGLCRGGGKDEDGAKGEEVGGEFVLRCVEFVRGQGGEDSVVLFLSQSIEKRIPIGKYFLKFHAAIASHLDEEIFGEAVHVGSLRAKIEWIPIGVDADPHRIARRGAAASEKEEKEEEAH